MAHLIKNTNHLTLFNDNKQAWEPIPLTKVLLGHLLLTVLFRLPISLLSLSTILWVFQINNISLSILLLSIILIITFADIIELLIERPFTYRQHLNKPAIPILITILEVIIFAVISLIIAWTFTREETLVIVYTVCLTAVRAIFMLTLDKPWQRGTNATEDAAIRKKLHEATQETIHEIQAERIQHSATIQRK
ncbi:hypothetical protein [Bifidobacterium oedipodis]|uniref:Uncharacterized protein n=1 Tax=Bifidobacterium oedipodis TaxID=2675322 RepID=A0A7Y0EQ26_9BIFI|nr:hypothetical protein [Bifidobacterium sp. DSM 109957]NMM94340.1 hypothetical protein [Bifidobacterium sp. DSM 109957]